MINQFVANTTALTSFLCFGLAFAMWKYGKGLIGNKIVIAQSSSWIFLGILYILSQFGGDWFLSYQRAWFRFAITAIIGVRFFSLMHNTVND
jgi:hypothetical protein